MANGGDFLDNDFKEVSIYGASEGYGEVYITFNDFATYDEDDLSGTTITVYVNVYAPDGGYTGDYGKSGDDWNAGYDYDDAAQGADKLNLWLLDEPYSVLTDLSDVEIPKGFTVADGTFEGEKVKTVNYGSEIVIYALWNHWNGDVIFRTYDPQTQEFGEPASFTQGGHTYYLLKLPAGTEITEGYRKKELTLNGNKVEALVSDTKGYEDFYYIYAMTDGEGSMYSFDQKEGSLQRVVELQATQEETQPEKAVVRQESFFNKKTFMIGACAAGVIIIVLLILLIISRRKFKDLTEDDY